jgi:VIT1/CCC1 family predicted Fe2+/Mn2+ transporter
MGIAGADPGRTVVMLGGIAGLLAGALSMALGEWISVRSAAESFTKQLRTEAEELEEFPEEEEEELTLIYRAKGLSPEDARATAKRILSQPETALETLAREELGMSQGEAGNPWTAAIASLLTFVSGAIIPVIPWLFVGGNTAAAITVVAAGTGLFFVGAATSLLTGRSMFFSGGRMLVLGLAAAAITFGIGAAIGVEVGG